MTNNKLPKKLNLTKKQKERNARIFEKIIEAIIFPVFMGILIGYGNLITTIITIIWLSIGIYGLFTNWEDFIIQIILRSLGIID